VVGEVWVGSVLAPAEQRLDADKPRGDVGQSLRGRLAAGGRPVGDEQAPELLGLPGQRSTSTSMVRTLRAKYPASL
jgi:hypothetical protein